MTNPKPQSRCRSRAAQTMMLLLLALTFISHYSPLHGERAESRNALRCCMESHYTSNQPAAPPRRQGLRTQATTLPPGSWLCSSVTFSQGILEWTQDSRGVWQEPACIQVSFLSSHISSIRVSGSLISVLRTSTVICLSCSVGAGKAKVSGLPEQWIPQSCSTALKKDAFCLTISEMCYSCYFQRYC